MLAFGEFHSMEPFSSCTAKTGQTLKQKQTEGFPSLHKYTRSLTVAPSPLEVDMAPLAIIQSLVTGFPLDAPRAHIHDQVEKSIQQLYGKEVGPGLSVGLCTLQAAMAEQQQAAGLCGAEVKRYGARLLCVPPGQCQVGRRRVEGDRHQRFHILTAECQVTMDTDLRVSLFSQP